MVFSILSVGKHPVHSPCYFDNWEALGRSPSFGGELGRSCLEDFTARVLAASQVQGGLNQGGSQDVTY